MKKLTLLLSVVALIVAGVMVINSLNPEAEMVKDEDSHSTISQVTIAKKKTPSPIQTRAPIVRQVVTLALKNEVPKLGFRQIVPEPKFEGLQMIGKVNRNSIDDVDGKILRALRHKPVTDVVEYRFNIPPGMVLAMAAHEAPAALMTNGADDGGAGTCHMQPNLADEFGLKVYQDCKDRVNHAHGRALRQLIINHNHDMRKLSGLDDRLHPIINLDAVGRMLAIHIQTRRPSHKSYDGTDQMQAALFRYSGRPNTEYWNKVMELRNQLQDPRVIERVRQRFNKLNPNLVIDGEPGDFDTYLEASWKRWKNFGLEEYKQLPLYSPKGTKEIHAKYGKPSKP